MSGEAREATPPRIIPENADRAPFAWTDGQEGRLHIPHCSGCSRWVLPPEPDCPVCGGALHPRPVSGDGTVFTYTIDFHPFNPAVPVPYVIAVVELADQPGLRLASNVVDCPPESVDVGMQVQARFESSASAEGVVYFPVFVPRESSRMAATT